MLIYLKNKNNVNIQIPTIGYYTDSAQLLPFISIMGIKASSSRTFGPYYYFTDFNEAFRGAWSSNYKSREIDNKIITDDNNKKLKKYLTLEFSNFSKDKIFTVAKIKKGFNTSIGCNLKK